MKNKEKVIGVLEGIGTLVFGVLIATLGIGKTMNTYLGIAACVFGTALLIYSCYLLFKGKDLLLFPLVIAGILIAIGVGIFTNNITFEVLINILLFALMGAGCAILVFGLYTIVKYSLAFGITQMVLGAGLLALALCYHFFPEFRSYFWLITGIVVALIGGLQVVFAFERKR